MSERETTRIHIVVPVKLKKAIRERAGSLDMNMSTYINLILWHAAQGNIALLANGDLTRRK